MAARFRSIISPCPSMSALCMSAELGVEPAKVRSARLLPSVRRALLLTQPARARSGAPAGTGASIEMPEALVIARQFVENEPTDGRKSTLPAKES
jgi:hypothetical protein